MLRILTRLLSPTPSLRRSFLFLSSSRPSGTAISSLPQQQRSPDRQGAAYEMAAPPRHHPHPFFCKCLPDWSTTPPANSHTVDWDLDLMRYISLSPPLSANHSLSCPLHKPMRGLLTFIWSKSSSQSAGSSLSFKLVFPVSQWALFKKTFMSFANSWALYDILYLSG